MTSLPPSACSPRDASLRESQDQREASVAARELLAPLIGQEVLSHSQVSRLAETLARSPDDRWADPYLRSTAEHTRVFVDRLLASHQSPSRKEQFS